MKLHKKIKTAGVVLFSTALLSGCSIGNTDIVFLQPVHFNEVFKIGDEVCKKEEAKVYLANYMNIYGDVYGVNLWEQESKQDALEQYIKDVTVSQLSQVKCMNGIAKQKEIELTKAEKEKVKEAAQKYYESLTKEERRYMRVRKSDIEMMYEEYWIAAKVSDELLGNIDEEVSDDEARIIEGMQIFVKDESTAKEVESRLKRGQDFAAVASMYNEKEQIEIIFGREDMPKEVVKEAFELENGELSGMIATDEGYYFIKCINKYNEELTDKNKVVILEKRRSKAFDDVYDGYVEESSAVLNKKMWEKISAVPEDNMETDSFFKIIDGIISN